MHVKGRSWGPSVVRGSVNVPPVNALPTAQHQLSTQVTSFIKSWIRAHKTKPHLSNDRSSAPPAPSEGRKAAQSEEFLPQ